MNPATTYTLFGLMIAALGTIGLPLYLNRSKNVTSAREQRTVDSQAVAQMFKDERDRLQLRMEVMQAEYERQITGMRTEYERQITELHSELQGLYRQLYQQPPKSP